MKLEVHTNSLLSRQKKDNSIVKCNRVNQNFKVNSKNKLWFGDITYILTAEGTLTLSTTLGANLCRIIVIGRVLHA